MKQFKIFSVLFITISILLNLSFTSVTAYANSTEQKEPDVISLFPIEHYDQKISDFIKPTDQHYDQVLLDRDLQQRHFAAFLDHYFGSSSPWNAHYVNKILQNPAPDDLKTIEEVIIKDFNNDNKTQDHLGYGANFRPYTSEWITTIAKNINVNQLIGTSYQPQNRGITINNLPARALPTNEVYFFHFKLPGQGYPFDNLQMSAVWAGTPVYIIAETEDHEWMLVITPDLVGWVQSEGVGRVDQRFIDIWTNAAKNKLAAITHTKTSIIDNDHQQFLFSAYVGAVFPVNASASQSNANNDLFVPALDNNTHQAVIKTAIVNPEDVVLMPITATPHHFAEIMKTLIGRPYGWGGMYFYNDCSAELKSLMTPFGIYLPRHSSGQMKAGKTVDLSSDSTDKRLAYLKENGQAFLTVVYLGGHVFLYIGNYPNPNVTNSNDQSDALIPMSYQNIWGLSPTPPTRRAVIGKSVLLPLLSQYPEDTRLASLAGKKIFQVSYLNQIPNNAAYLIRGKTIIDLRGLMYPDPITNWFTP